MLPLILVLLVAQSAFGAPSVQLTQYSINEIPRARDNGKLVSSAVIESAFELVDGGDTNIYILTVEQILNDLANQADAGSQAMALSQTIAALGELATGIPGDSCAEAALINAWVSGNSGAVSQALSGYLNNLLANIDLISRLSVNPEAVRLSSGLRGNCLGGGRAYSLEGAWDSIIAGSSPYTVGWVNEQYCASRRLYSAMNVRSNNVGAAITAAALPPVQSIFQAAAGPIANFLRAAASGNVGNAGAVAKNAISQAASRL